jgi:hypothetical protein
MIYQHDMGFPLRVMKKNLYKKCVQEKWDIQEGSAGLL